MRILVTGASGFIGRHLVAKLRRDGKSVTVLSRGDASGDPDRFAGPADLAALDGWPDWPAGIDALVHLAAANPSRGDPAAWPALLHANVAGTASLARRAAREGVRRIVFLSTANVHAPAPVPVRETDPLEPQSPYATSKAEAETAFWTALEGSRTQGIVLRPAPVFGSGGRGNVAALVKLARGPAPLPIVGLGGMRSLIAVDHLCDLVSRCIETDGAVGGTFLAADPGPLTPAAVVRALREGWGRRPGIFALPSPVRRAFEGIVGGRGPMRDFVLDTRSLSERTGWRAPKRAAERLAEMAAAGEL